MRYPLFVVALVTFAVLGSSCTSGSSLVDAVAASTDETAEADATGLPSDVEASESVSVHELEHGDCYNGEFNDTVVMSVDVVPCGEPHDNEVYATFELQTADFPGDDRVVELSMQGCFDRFADFTGIEYAGTALEVTYFHPTGASWRTLEDREVTCAVYDPAGTVTGTLEDAGDAFAIAFEGDCMDEGWLKVDCADDHYAEIYLERELDGDAYPGAVAVENNAAELCEDGFAEFVGVEWADSTLDYVYWAPAQEEWDTGYKVVSCAVYDPAGPLTGSVQGSGR